MKGVANTIYFGDKIEQIDLTVIGVMPNAIAPKTDVILVRLEGPHADESGVVAGMSGSPVYIDGKLAGAVALKLGIFTKQAIAGVMPIEEMLAVMNAPPGPSDASNGNSSSSMYVSTTTNVADRGPSDQAAGIPLTQNMSRDLGLDSKAMLQPIGLPLVASGLKNDTLTRFSDQLSALGFAATSAGGIAPADTSDSQLQPGDMVGISLVSGDLSLAAGCTVTTIIRDSVFICGHPIFGAGGVDLPMARGHVLLTLSSALESTKIMTVGGLIGAATEDRTTAVMGKIGTPAPAIPVEMSFDAPGANTTYHFDVAENPKLTPVLLGVVTFNALSSSPIYNDGMALKLDGQIDIEGHPSVELRDVFAPTNLQLPDGFLLATLVQTKFADVYQNAFEKPHVTGLKLHITSLAERRVASIENAWSEKSTVHAGDKLTVKVQLRPYRGEPFLREVPIEIPAQATPGLLRLLVSDATALDQTRDGANISFSNLDELIRNLNDEHANDRLYVSLLQSTPTLMIGDKELPDVPPSAMQVLKEGHGADRTAAFSESRLGEWSVAMDQVVAGQQTLMITVE